MKIAVVTGASSGIGKALAQRLLNENYKVYALGRDFEASGLINNEGLIKYPINLENRDEIAAFCKKIAENRVDLLVNCAGVAYYGLFESERAEHISEMVNVNILAPMLLTNGLLDKIRRCEGTVVNISSVTGKQPSSTHAAVYGATKAALTNFGQTLFEENRKHNLRVINIHPDLTNTRLYRNADFTATGEPDSSLEAEDVAGAVMFAVSERNGLCVTDLTIRPQKNKIRKKS